MKKGLFIFLLTLVCIAVQAQIPNGYYNNANGKTGDELKNALHNIVKEHTSISYSQIWNAYYSTDHRDDDVTKVWDIYSDIPNGNPKYLFTLGTAQCGTYSQEGNCYNREHSWPESWFNNDGTARTDLHHIFPTDGFVNNKRGNLPYGEVQRVTWTSTNGSKVGDCKSSLGYSGEVFEPINAYKGDIARAYFYMSVRYYSEDNNWGSSGMTNKSVINDWAMTMLLNWNDLDPVSQKEIDRNNVIYNDYQHNRNPFIDHPEYARMIWDPSWTGGTSYSITCATNLQNGSISVPESAIEGSTVAITATPDPGYMVNTYSVYKTGSPSTTIPVSSNGTFTMPGYAVTVSATFVQNNTYYDITLGTVSHGSISASATSAKSGTTIYLTATINSGYSLYSWYVFKTGDMNTTVSVNGNSFVMPAYDVTVMATFVQGSVSNGDYVKVTSTADITNGDYLIVNGNYQKAFNGGLSTLDANYNTISVTISNNTIGSNSETDAAIFTISSISGGYSIRSASGLYIGYDGNSNSLNTSTNALTNTISITNGNAIIKGTGTSTLQYNNGVDRFRYYGSTQKTIQLYKKTAPTTTPTHTIHFNNNGGTGLMDDQSVTEFEPTTLNANVFTREGFVFDGWNTLVDGSGDYYADKATIILLDDLTLYAQWDPLYTVTLADVANGSISADLTQAVEETTITLTAIPDEGYELGQWLVTYNGNNTIEVVENQFEMPADNVTVSASFIYVGQPFAQQYYLVTSADQLVAGRTYLIVSTQYGKALGTTQNTNNRSAASVTVDNDVIAEITNSVCELTLGGSTGQWTFKDGNKGYLYAPGGGNYLRTQTSISTNSKWSITLSSGAATMVSNANVSQNTLKYNTNNSIFSCYASTSGGIADVCLFIRAEVIEHTSMETLTQVFPFDKHVVKSGAVVTLDNSVSVADPGLLVIEEDGQLIHHSTNVKATVQKTIAGYEGNNGWYTIAEPFTTFDPSQISIGTYDLYAYDEDTELEWLNHKAHPNEFPVNSSSGYLYAHSPEITLNMTGKLNNGDYSEEVSLSYGNSIEAVKGFNLLGNPTAHDITFSKSDNVADGYYYLDNNEAWVYEPGNSVPAGRGFLVKANAPGQSVTLNDTEKHENQSPALIQIDVDGELAYLKPSNGVSMPLLDFNGHHSSIYLSHEGKDYILLAIENAETIELRYLPQHDGQHQLRVTLDGTHVEYLHLVDLLTGTDCDLLQNPIYNFESKNNDDNARFQLVFKPN